ncbi:MAG: hypothetical protein ACLFRD_04900 [Nitriliruptoraceae bacterium]
MPSSRAMIVIGALLLATGTLYAGSAVRIPPAEGLTAIAVLVIGVALLLVGALRQPTTVQLIAAGAVLQLVGGLLLIVGTAELPAGFVAAGIGFSAVGFWLLLSGVIAAAVKLALHERSPDRAEVSG